MKQLQEDSLQVLICMCDFLARFSMHDIACGSFLSWHGFSKCDSVFSLALPFMDRLDEMGFHILVELNCWMDSKLSEVDLLNEKHMA